MMSDLSNTLRNMKFMQRTLNARKKTSKKPPLSSSSTITQPAVATIPSNPIINTPSHTGCWRIIENETLQSSRSQTTPSSMNGIIHPAIIYRPSVFSMHERNYSRLSFQNYNKKIESSMIKFGLVPEIRSTKTLEDGELDSDEEEEKEENKSKMIEDNQHHPIQEESKVHHSTLTKTIRKKFQKKSLARIQFGNNNNNAKNKRRRSSRKN